MGIRVWPALALTAAAVFLSAQQIDFNGVVVKQGAPRKVVAIPDLRGAGDAQQFMVAFNQTLWSDIDGSGIVTVAAKTLYPVFTPQQPADFQQPANPAELPKPPHPGEMVAAPTGGGRWMSDWSTPPLSANYLAFGYAAIQNGVFVAYGYFFDLHFDAPAHAQVIAARYLGSPDEDGARKAAHQFAADILAALGGKSLYGTHIYYVHQSAPKAPSEIWVMDPDGSNQKQITKANLDATGAPAVSPDGSKIACTAYPAADKPARIFLFAVDPLRQLTFLNSQGNYTAHPTFTPDGKQIVFDSSADDGYRIFVANPDGGGAHLVSLSKSIQVEPKVNPKNPALIAFTSDRSGTPQIYTMNSDGGDPERLTNGIGEAVNPAWNQDGEHLAFAWTQGYEPGAFNIFVMEVASHQYLQLTKAAGKNETPAWAPDGAHLAFSSNRSGSFQIWTTLLDGTQVRQLTTQGKNTNPAWGQ
jgi:TolB protein